MTEPDFTQRILQDIQQRLIALDRKVEDGFLNLNVRMTVIEGKLDAVGLSQTAQSDRLDNLEKRVQQIERRLELAE